MAVIEEPVLTRLDRLDYMIKQVEGIRGHSRSSPKSSNASSGTLTVTSDGQPSSSVEFSPKVHCRPIDDVMVETELKGTLIQRVGHLEERVWKLEEEVEAEKKGELESNPDDKMKMKMKKKKKRSLKQIIKRLLKSGSIHTRP